MLVGYARTLVDDEELMRLIIGKYRLKECAALLSVNYSTVCGRARRPEFLQKLKELNAELYAQVDKELTAIYRNVSERVLEMSERALDKLEELLETSDDNRLIAKIASDLLDRNPTTSKSTKAFVENKHSFINPLLLKHAAATAMEIEKSSTKELGAGNASVN